MDELERNYRRDFYPRGYERGCTLARVTLTSDALDKHAIASDLNILLNELLSSMNHPNSVSFTCAEAAFSGYITQLSHAIHAIHATGVKTTFEEPFLENVLRKAYLKE